ncbi:alanine racemase, partial [Mesorhizobium sp.]
LSGLAATFTDTGHPLPVLVECDTGMGRCGVQSPAEAVALAKVIDQARGLTFGGLMTYPAAGRAAEAEAWL